MKTLVVFILLDLVSRAAAPGPPIFQDSIFASDPIFMYYTDAPSDLDVVWNRHFKNGLTGECLTTDSSLSLYMGTCECDTSLMYIGFFCENLWFHDQRGDGELGNRRGDLMYDGTAAAGTVVYVSATGNAYWNYIRLTGRMTVRDDDTLCVTLDTGDAADPLKLAVCDDSPQQFWSVHFEAPFSMPCMVIGAADTCIPLPSDTCGGCPECHECFISCQDLHDPAASVFYDPCCGCDLATSYCFGVEEPANDTRFTCDSADNTCPGSTVKNYHCFEAGGECRDDACASLTCGAGTGCYTWESIDALSDSMGPFEPTCTPDPCQNFECYSPNSECVLVGAPGGDKIPWCQCKENYINVCVGTFMLARADHIYKRHLLDNLYDIDRLGCAIECMDKKKCQYYSYHEGRDGHCKLYSRFGQPILKQRKGWMASSPLFHPHNMRTGQDYPFSIPPDEIVPSAFIFETRNAESLFMYSTDAFMSPDAIRQTTGGADLNAAFYGAEWNATLSGADWKAALSGAQQGSFSIKRHDDSSGKKLLDTNSLNIADMMHEVIPEDVDDMPIKGSCAPKDGVKGCGRGDEHCYCTPDCKEFHDCCPDYEKYCGT